MAGKDFLLDVILQNTLLQYCQQGKQTIVTFDSLYRHLLGLKPLFIH